MLCTTPFRAVAPCSPTRRASSARAAISVLRSALVWAPAATSSEEALISSVAAEAPSMRPRTSSARSRISRTPERVLSAMVAKSSACRPSREAASAICPRDSRRFAPRSSRTRPICPASSLRERSKRTVRSPWANRAAASRSSPMHRLRFELMGRASRTTARTVRAAIRSCPIREERARASISAWSKATATEKPAEVGA